jgi:hypothetical protein
MYDDQDAFRRRLEQITASADRSPPRLTQDDAALRAAWLRLGDLLQRAATEAAEAAPPTVVAPVGRRRHGRPARVAVLAASLAASLLLAVGVWSLWPTKAALHRLPPPAVADLAVRRLAPPVHRDSAPRPTVLSHSKIASSARESVPGWDDLDQQIARVGRAAVQVAHGQLASAGDVGLIQDQLQHIRRGVDAGQFQ